MSINIFSSKAFAIGPGAQQGNPEIDLFVTVPGAFQNMPDKYKDDPTFKLAVKAGDIRIVNGMNKEEKIADEVENEVIDHTPKMNEAQEFYEKLKVMNREDTIELAEIYDLQIKKDEKLGSFKKRIFEAYKLNNESEEAE